MNVKFQDVYDAYHGKIHRYLDRLVGQEESEDLTQEVFLKIDRGLTGFQMKSKVSTWVYRIATNAALDRLRSASYRQNIRELSVSGEDGKPDIELTDQDTDTAKKTPSPFEQVARAEMDDCILEFINRLPPDYRAVVVLSELKELKNQEVAEILGVSVDTVKIRLHRARQRLKKAFEEGCTLSHSTEGGLVCDRKS